MILIAIAIAIACNCYTWIQLYCKFKWLWGEELWGYHTCTRNMSVNEMRSWTICERETPAEVEWHCIAYIRELFDQTKLKIEEGRINLALVEFYLTHTLLIIIFLICELWPQNWKRGEKTGGVSMDRGLHNTYFPAIIDSLAVDRQLSGVSKIPLLVYFLIHSRCHTLFCDHSLYIFILYTSNQSNSIIIISCSQVSHNYHLNQLKLISWSTASVRQIVNWNLKTFIYSLSAT